MCVCGFTWVLYSISLYKKLIQLSIFNQLMCIFKVMLEASLEKKLYKIIVAKASAHDQKE